MKNQTVANRRVHLFFKTDNININFRNYIFWRESSDPSDPSDSSDRSDPSDPSDNGFISKESWGLSANSFTYLLTRLWLVLVTDSTAVRTVT
jgi:hypothetical protein